VLLLGVVGLTACIDQTRVNSDCRWSDTEARKLDLTLPADREHLRVDAKIGGELAVRFGDAHYRNSAVMWRPYFEQCNRAMVDSITVRHGVTQADIEVAEHARVWWVDIVLVFVPMALLIAFAVDRVVLRVYRSFEPDDRTAAISSVALLVPVVALVGLGIAQFWAFMIEGVLLRNGHISVRVAQIPVMVHGWIAFFVALVICTVVAWVRSRVTPLTGASDSFAARRTRARAISVR
jgi:hypothetical protein